VTLPPAEPVESGPRGGVEFVAPAAGGDEGATSRLTLRLPDYLKPQIEAAAAAEALSVNAWLVRLVAGVLVMAEPIAPGRESPGRHLLTGWVR
jgi:hypothetical protein